KIIAARYDGFGERMLAFLNAIYISKNTNLEFCYKWPYQEYSAKIFESTNCSNKVVANPYNDIVDENNFFSKKFIKKYSIELKESFFDGSLLFSKNNKLKLQDIYKYPKECSLGYFSTQYDLSQICNDVNSSKYYEDIKNIWDNLDLVNNFKLIKEQVANMEIVKNGFTALHIRMGDAIYYDNGNNAFFAKKKNFPIHLAVEIIKEEISKNQLIVIFSDDYETSVIVKDFVEDLMSIRGKILVIRDYISKLQLNHFESSFFEIELMRYASKIYGSGRSGFSNLAFRISGGKSEFISIHDYFTDNQKYNIFMKYINQLEIHPYAKAFSYLHLYIIANNLMLDISIQKRMIENAIMLVNNTRSYMYYFIYMYLLLQEEKYFEVEAYIKEKCTTDRDYFFSYLFQIDGYDNTLLYSFLFFEFLKIQDIIKYPFICFILCKLFDVIKIHKLKCDINDKLYLERLNTIVNFLNTFSECNVNFNYSTGAVYRVENQLSYKIGKILINTKDIKSILKAPIEIIMSVLEHKRKSKIYQTLVNIDKKYAMPPLESYSDFHEALRLKEHLTYKLGKSFLDNPYVFIFKVKKIYKEWKNNKGV
ncbi:hypothetical protein Q8V47_001507, partial [Campylobacter jejuni]|nr:hypothetical protein [Campylobacter jejuni]ELI2349435.1 hypothetical protein [Campylobacter jejuni]